MAEEKEKKKEKASKLLTRFSAGGLVFKRSGDTVKWLVIRPRGTERWQFPKGGIDKGETGKEAALREVAEEGGVKARIVQKLGNETYFYYLEGKRIFQHVAFYLMEYVEDTTKGIDEKEIDEVRLLPYEEALQVLSFENDRELLKKGQTILKAGLQENLV
jgi:8-oxo-dGTP diphosphatase